MKTRRVRRAAVRFAVIPVVVTALAAVAVSPSSATATRAAQAEFERVKVKAARISLNVPNHWLKADLTKESLEGFAAALETQNPDLSQQIRESSEFAAETSKFYAIDLATGSDMSVMALPGAGDEFPSDVRRFREDLGSEGLAPGYELVEVHPATVGGKRAYRVLARGSVIASTGDEVASLVAQLILRRGADLIIVVVGATDDEAGKKTIDDVLASVRPASGKTDTEQKTSHV